MIDIFDCYYCGKRLTTLLLRDFQLYEKHKKVDRKLDEIKRLREARGILTPICNVCKQKELTALLKKYNILSDIEM